MKTSWKSFTQKQQSRMYVLPEGWDTRDTIAAELGCSSDNVRKMLHPAVRSGAVECKQIPLWDEVLKRVSPVTCYRQTGKS